MKDADQQLQRQVPGRPTSTPLPEPDQALSYARLAGLLAVAASVLAFAACLVFVPILAIKINEIHQQLQMESQEFNALADNAWQELLEARHLSEGGDSGFRREPRQTNYNANRGRGPSSIRSYPANNNNAGANRGRPTSRNNGGNTDQGILQPARCECQTFNRCPVGPPGPAGEPGTPGERGESGVNGERGLQGTMPIFEGGFMPDTGCMRCPNGVEGSPGAPGTPGKEGAKGEPGRDGNPGASPARGRPGQPGEQGEPGKSGSSGEKGFKGQDGQRGAQGEKGKRGTDGLRGPRGQNGLPGRHGSRGQPGRAGRPGELGRPGTGGNPGFRGNSGVAGLPGTDRGYCNCPPRRNTGNNGRVVQPQPFTDRPPVFTDRPDPFTASPQTWTPVYPGNNGGGQQPVANNFLVDEQDFPGDHESVQPQPQQPNYPINGGGSRGGPIQPFGGGGRQVIQPQRGRFNDDTAGRSRQRSARRPISATVVHRSRFH